MVCTAKNVAHVGQGSAPRVSVRQASAISRVLFIGLACAFILTFTAPIAVHGLSEAQRGAISQSCPTIKQSLRQLQKVDAKARNYLGTTYETIFNKFIVPLNLRLVKNNQATFSSIQSGFSSNQAQFRSVYTEYMRELENLLASDCKQAPDEFYSQLEVVRQKRLTLHEITQKLSQLASEQYQSVLDLRQKL